MDGTGKVDKQHIFITMITIKTKYIQQITNENLILKTI